MAALGLGLRTRFTAVRLGRLHRTLWWPLAWRGGVLVAGGIVIILNRERAKFVQWLGEDVIAGVGWVVIAFFGGLGIMAVWCYLRDSGVVPTVYARRSDSGWRVGSLAQLLSGRMVAFPNSGSVIIESGKVTVSRVGRNGVRRQYELRLIGPSGTVVIWSTLQPGQVELGRLCAWLKGLGIDCEVS